MTKRTISRWARNWAFTVGFLALASILCVGGFLLADAFPIAAIVFALVLFTGLGSYQYTQEVLEEEDRIASQENVSK